MKKIKLTEADLVRIIELVINEPSNHNEDDEEYNTEEEPIVRRSDRDRVRRRPYSAKARFRAGLTEDDVFPGPKDGGLGRFLRSKPEGGKTPESPESKAAEQIFQLFDHKIGGWTISPDHKVTQETQQYLNDGKEDIKSQLEVIINTVVSEYQEQDIDTELDAL